jgi:hypothetical protein
MNPTHVLPFGKHKNEPLSAVPSSYLDWMLRTVKLSSGLTQALADELQRRGVAPPPPPSPRPEPACRRCGCSRLLYQKCEDAIGRPWIRRACSSCGQHCGHAPPTEANLARAVSSPTAALDVLTLADQEGVALCSDGRCADFRTHADWRRASPKLRDLLLECKATLGRLMGDTRHDEEGGEL